MTMSTHNDEQHETGADEQEHGHPKKPKRFRRWALLVVAFLFVMLVWSCTPTDYLTSTPISELSTGDAVVAIRMGEARSQSGLSAPIQDNWVMLLDAQGKHRAAVITEGEGGELLWTERGISYGSGEWDYLTTENGTRREKRSGWKSSEVQRYELSDGRIIVVYYEMDLGYQVDTIELDGSITSVSTPPGTRGDIGQCGDRILSIVDTEQLSRMKTEQLSRMKAEAFEAYAAQSAGDGEQPEVLSVVIQLNDRDGDTPRILGVAPMIDGLVSGQREFACEGDVITIPSVQTDDSRVVRVMAEGREEGTMVLERWDLSTGQRTIVPVIDEQGNPIEVNSERSIFHYQGVQVGNEYRFISEGRDAFSVDLTSGRGRYLFSHPMEKSARMLFQVTETGVYALEDRWDDRRVTLSFTQWESGERREVWTTSKLAGYLERQGFLDSYPRKIEAFTLLPGWDGGAQ